MKIPIAKLKAILLYFATFTDSRFLGKVKLMKLFYFLDFLHVKMYGTPVTYDTYINLEHGPIPSAILNLVNNAEDDADHSVLSDTIKFEKNDDENIHRVTSLRKFTENDQKYFTPAELLILEKVIQRFGSQNTKYIEDASHNESPWKNTNLLDEIPYTLAANDADCAVSKEDIELSVSL